MPKKRECSVKYAIEHGGTVRYTIDPFASDVWNDSRKVWICDACAERAADDV